MELMVTDGGDTAHNAGLALWLRSRYGNGFLAVKSTDGLAVEHGASGGELRGVHLLPLTLVSTFM